MKTSGREIRGFSWADSDEVLCSSCAGFGVATTLTVTRVFASGAVCTG